MKCKCGYETLLTSCPHCGNGIEENLHPDKKSTPYFNKTLVEGTEDYDKFQNGDL